MRSVYGISAWGSECQLHLCNVRAVNSDADSNSTPPTA